jgi:hypothetical protein
LPLKSFRRCGLEINCRAEKGKKSFTLLDAIERKAPEKKKQMNVLHLLIGEDCSQRPEITLEIICSERTRSHSKLLGKTPRTNGLLALNVLKQDLKL